MSCACALGRTNEQVLANLLARSGAGMKKLSGEIPGREVYFGAVEGDLPAVEEPEFDMRADQLLKLAVENAREKFKELTSRHPPERIGVVLGVSNTGVDEAMADVHRWLDAGVPPEGMQSSRIELGTPSEYLQKLLGTEGPAYSVSTACSSSAKAFAAARRMLSTGIADAVVTGGVDGKCRFALNGFHALNALSAGRCRPLAPDRDGICLGEGVALFAMEREGDADVFFAGCGETSDAYHATAPDPEGLGAEAAMRDALDDAGISPCDVGYLNLHGTGTLANDAMELKAVERVFASPRPRFESTKDLTGHCLGAAGAVEAALCWLLLASGNAKGAAMSNSFAFGGSNASVVFTGREAR